MIRFVLATLTVLSLTLPARALDIQQVTSPGGLNAWLVEAHDIPFTALEIRFRGGASLDAPEKRGAITLMAATLEEGAGQMDAQAFAEATESLAAQFSFDVDDDTLKISARMLTENRDKAVDLLREALTNPRFDQVAVDRVRGQVLSIIASDEEDPNAIAGRTFRQLAYGDHPYGSSLNGTAESVKALSREDIFDAKARVMARDRLVISAVGDITPAELGVLLDHLLGDLPETGAPMPPRAELGLAGGVSVVDYDTPQSVVIFGQQGLPMDDPDFFAAYVINQILGEGGFASRLMEEVREKRGLTYGIYTYLAPKDLAETWQGSFASANGKVAEAIAVTRAEWARMATGEVTDQELNDAKTYLTGAYPLRFDGNGQIAGILAGMQLNHMPIDYVNTRNAKVEAVTKEDIKRVAQRLLDADALRFVVVGKPEGLDTSASN
ncbi:M16 family metallopeptidase [Sedimentimonas flavescens]|uniref:M16 family metallopeptidase n=1 Tax=Sedimentimonas flavescens TaxID=2851012 RepID=UPI001C4A07A3|nr:pitrilysin family protein [Sedimentimonas flavescens]MBW0158505.1 insulinase family protein [Sedimentimonas flavescens]MCT2540951.1 insulinase family protein [Sedimentimonas flavescens]